jgi:microcystin-dependent protein
MKSSLKIFMGGLVISSGVTLFNSTPAQAGCGSSPYIGTVCWTMAAYCPRDYSQANGQLLSTNEFGALFSLLGNAYGGDGRTNFALPDLRGRVAIGTGQGVALTPVYRGQKVGMESNKLSVENMPAHAHALNLGNVTINGTVTGVSENGDLSNPDNAFAAARPTSGAAPGRKPYYAPAGAGSTVAMSSSAVELSINPSQLPTDPAFQPPASQQALPLRAPQVGVIACIATNGLYPPKP